MSRPATNQMPRRLLLVLLAGLVFFLLCTGGCISSWFKDNTEAKRSEGPSSRPTACPLCGSPVDDPAAIQRRPVAVKIENDPEARPQSGLDKACVVYEEITEGGITRYMAIFLCRDADPVGPIRSARPVDIDLAYPYQALLCHCGGAPITLSMINSSKMADLDELPGCDAYWRFRGRRSPHNLYAGVPQLREAGNEKYPFDGEVGPAFEFMSDQRVEEMKRERQEELENRAEHQADPSGGEYTPSVAVVNNLYIPYKDICSVRYSYDPAIGKFYRFVSGVEHTDFTTGELLTIDTVIVQYVEIKPSGITDVHGADTPDNDVIGKGRAQVFMLGQVIEATWSKGSRGKYTEYRDGSGEEIELKPGSVWIQLVPDTSQVTID